MRRLLARLAAAYERAQVELHGKYSIERVADLQAYHRKYPLHRCIFLLIVTPLPCLAIIVLTDLLPLNPISAGPSHNNVLWARAFIVSLAISSTLLEQARYFIPGLPCSTRTLWTTSVVVGVCTVAYARLLASVVGFPTPFLVICCSPCFCGTHALCGLIAWGRLLREQPGLRAALVSYIKVVVVQLSLTAVYPAFNFLFLQHTGLQQTAIAMLLPILKLLAKNAVSAAFNRQLDDFRPGVVILNVEVFHALFVSCCMQSSTSWVTTLALMCSDFVHSWFGLHDVDNRLDVINALESKLHKRSQPMTTTTPRLPRLPVMETSLLFVRSDDAVTRDSRVRHRPAGVSCAATPWSAVVPLTVPEQIVEPSPHKDRINGSPTAGPHDSFAILTTSERVQYVAVTLQVLHITEFLLLVEFVEVVIPVVYSVYMAAMFYLPNRAYYPQLVDIDAHSLRRTIGSVLAYAALEFVSFLAFCVALRRRVLLSPIHQLAYVIHTQWSLVQSKIILWVIFSVHMTLEHFGYDYSFRFAWLKSSDSKS